MRKLAWKLLATGTMLASSSTMSEAHSLPVVSLPLHHATLLVRPILPVQHSLPTPASELSLFLSKTKNPFVLAAARIPGVSGATNSVLQRSKLIVQSSFLAGKNSQISNELSISTGQLNGDNYFRQGAGSSSYVNQGLGSVDALGSNPLNIGGPGGTSPISTTTIPNFQITTLTYQPVLAGSKAVTAQLLRGPIVHPSGAQRALAQQDKTLSSAAFALGAKSVVSLGPIEGGRLFGTLYFLNSGKSFASYNQIAYAFGKDPFNNPSIGFLNTTNPTSFIQFASGKVIDITSGQLFFTRYIQASGTTFGDYGGRFLAIGSNPFNFAGPFGGNVTVPNTLNLLNF